MYRSRGVLCCLQPCIQYLSSDERLASGWRNRCFLTAPSNLSPTWLVGTYSAAILYAARNSHHIKMSTHLTLDIGEGCRSLRLLTGPCGPLFCPCVVPATALIQSTLYTVSEVKVLRYVHKKKLGSRYLCSCIFKYYG